MQNMIYIVHRIQSKELYMYFIIKIVFTLSSPAPNCVDETDDQVSVGPDPNLR